jgi:hypothetical protein
MPVDYTKSYFHINDDLIVFFDIYNPDSDLCGNIKIHLIENNDFTHIYSTRKLISIDPLLQHLNSCDNDHREFNKRYKRFISEFHKLFSSCLLDFSKNLLQNHYTEASEIIGSRIGKITHKFTSDFFVPQFFPDILRNLSNRCNNIFNSGS